MQNKISISKVFFIAIFFLFISTSLFSTINQYGLVEEFFPQGVSSTTAQNEGEYYKIYLLTAGPGDKLMEVFLWWGHTAIVVEDSRGGGKVVYDFGVFSMPESQVAVNFIKGRIDYLVASRPGYYFDSMVNGFLQEGRWVVLQPLNLPAKKAYMVANYLKANVRPENSVYKYQFFSENCCTKVRDIINYATDGALYNYTKAPASKTVRDKFEEYIAKSYLVDWGTNFLVNADCDVAAKRWDLLYLPFELMKAVDELKLTNANGSQISLSGKASFSLPPGKSKELSLAGIDPKRSVLDGDPKRIIENTKTDILSLLFGIIVGTIAALLFLFGSKHFVVRIVGGVFAGVITFALFVAGTILFVLAFFSTQDATYGNLNLILVNPITMIVAFVLSILYAANVGKSKLAYTIYWIIMAVASIIMLVLDVVNLIPQDCLAITLSLLPFFLFMSLGGIFREQLAKKR